MVPVASPEVPPQGRPPAQGLRGSHGVSPTLRAPTGQQTFLGS